MKIYFAHPMSHYGTEYEKMCLENIQNVFPKAEIVNPSDEHHVETYKSWKKHGMRYWKQLVAGCDAIVFATYKDGEVGMGVYTEIMEMVEYNGFIFEVDHLGVGVVSLDTVYNIRPLSIQETRDRNFVKML